MSPAVAVCSSLSYATAGIFQSSQKIHQGNFQALQRLEGRIVDLRQLHRSASSYHLKALQLQNAEAVRRYEEAMFSCSEAIKSANLAARETQADRR